MYNLNQMAARHRKTFEVLRKSFLEQGYVDPRTKNAFNPADTITPSALRAEVVLQNNRREYVVEYGNVTTPSLEDQQKPLNTNDIFSVTDLGLFLSAVAGTDVTIVAGLPTPRPLSPQVAPLKTYPDPIQFAQPAGQHLGLETVYNGYFDVEVNNTKYVENIPTVNHRRVPPTQNAFTGGDAAANAAFQFGRFSIDAKEPGDGFVPMPADLYLWGISKNELILRLPDATNIQAEGPNGENRVVIILLGFLIAGVTRRRS